MYYDEAFNAIRDDALAKLTGALPEVTYLIVGANDGTRGDPLYKHTSHPKWRGTLFEPLPVPFEGLKAAYADRRRAILRNQAVVADAPGGTRKFYNVPFSSTNSSFRRDVIARHRKADGSASFEEQMVEVEVACVALDELIAEPGFRAPDVLLTDTEGYDHTLFQVWWARGWRPPFVEVEVIHLTAAEKVEIRDALDAAGYEIFWFETDIFALRKDSCGEGDLALYRLLRDQAIATFGLMQMVADERRARGFNPNAPAGG
ncbi:MAG: FkbM family methyltransferase [Tagaea sp.]|nr:FkbM family methyltransferase [Tagaea sp.]